MILRDPTHLINRLPLITDCCMSNIQYRRFTSHYGYRSENHIPFTYCKHHWLPIDNTFHWSIASSHWSLTHLVHLRGRFSLNRYVTNHVLSYVFNILFRMFSGVRVVQSLVFYVVFCRSLFALFVLFLLSIVLSAFLRLAPLVSSNFSFRSWERPFEPSPLSIDCWILNVLSVICNPWNLNTHRWTITFHHMTRYLSPLILV